MTLLVKILELFFFIAVVRTFLRMTIPAALKKGTSRRNPERAVRFDGKDCDISDADYEEVG